MPPQIVTTPKQGYTATTNASVLGISAEAVDEAIAQGKTSNWDAAIYAGKVLLYDGWNLFTAGFVGRQDARLQAVADGKLSDANLYTASALDAVTSLGSIVVAGEAASGVSGALGKGYFGSTQGLSGAAPGATFDIVQQAGQVGTYAVTNGQAGQQNFSITELTTNTVAGAAIGIGSAAGLDPTLTFDQTLEQVVNTTEQTGEALYKAVIADAASEAQTFRTVNATGGCFVAGTLIHTREGLVPIEKIRVGDFVLSQPEMKGELVYRKVVNTFVHDEKEVYLIDYSVVEEPVDVVDPVTFWEGKDESNLKYLVATGNHPFWVKNVGWTGVEHLETNHVCELKDGSSAAVLQVRKVFRTTAKNVGWTPDMDEDYGRQIDLRGRRVIVSEYDREEVDQDLEISTSKDAKLKCRVYNFEVEGFHTYYVGEDGIWVHNANCIITNGNAAAALEEAPLGVHPPSRSMPLPRYRRSPSIRPPAA